MGNAVPVYGQSGLRSEGVELVVDRINAALAIGFSLQGKIGHSTGHRQGLGFIRAETVNGINQRLVVIAVDKTQVVEYCIVDTLFNLLGRCRSG